MMMPPPSPETKAGSCLGAFAGTLLGGIFCGTAWKYAQQPDVPTSEVVIPLILGVGATAAAAYEWKQVNKP